MAFAPDLPFPKSAGDQIRSKDWNDVVNESKRLDTAKVERAGDAIAGPLSVAGALAVGKTSAAATAKLDVAGDLRVNDSNVLFRGGSDQGHGLGWFGSTKLFAATNVDGPVLFGNSGGALGSGVGGTQRIALRWDNSGNVVIGVPSTTLKVDVGDRIRLRQGANGNAGMFLFQTTPNADRAFVGMVDDNTVGLFGPSGSGSGVRMNVASFDVSLPADLAVAGEINSSRFKATTLMSSRGGPLPLSTVFTSSGGTLLVFASGTAFRNGGSGLIGMLVRIDNVTMAVANGFSNELSSHRAIPSTFTVVTSVNAGSHTLELSPRDGFTLTDGNDFFNVAVLELPFRNTGFVIGGIGGIGGVLGGGIIGTVIG